MDYLDCCVVCLEHAMLELLGGEAVEGFVEGGWIDLVQELFEGLDVFSILPFLLRAGGYGAGDEGEEEGGG